MELDNKRISKVADEAVRLKRENPEWTIMQAVKEAEKKYDGGQMNETNTRF